jgi:hypothetical protein
MAVKWRHTGSSGSFDRQAFYEYTSKSGKYYIKVDSDYAGTTIERYPSYAYFERYLLGENKGTRMKEWIRS